MKILFLLPVFCLALYVEANVDYRLLHLDRINSGPRNCTEKGLMCEDCHQLVMCMQMANGTFTKTPVQKCQGSTTCLDRQCTTKPNPLCSDLVNLAFICSVAGVYPDQFDCQKYHFCVPSSDNGPPYTNYDAYCENGYGYNPKTTFCDIRLPNGCPTSVENLPVPICDPTKPDELTGALKENPTFFYICGMYENTNLIYPFLYMCLNGKIYNKDNYACEDKPVTTTSVAPTTTTTESTTLSSTTEQTTLSSTTELTTLSSTTEPTTLSSTTEQTTLSSTTEQTTLSSTTEQTTLTTAKIIKTEK